MPKIKFIATPGMHSYHDLPDYHDGDVREIEDGLYRRLITDFPNNFVPGEAPKSAEGKSNKSMEGKANK